MNIAWKCENQSVDMSLDMTVEPTQISYQGCLI